MGDQTAAGISLRTAADRVMAGRCRGQIVGMVILPQPPGQPRQRAGAHYLVAPFE